MRPTATVATSSRLPVPSLGSGTARNCRNLTHLRGVSRVFRDKGEIRGQEISGHDEPYLFPPFLSSRPKRSEVESPP
jgi:hypothetical protein